MAADDHGNYFESLHPTEADINQNYGHRERYETGAAPSVMEGVNRRVPILKEHVEAAAKMSPASRQLIVDFEIGDQSAYEKRYKHPTWPQGDSGVTIGIGYDLGYCTNEDFMSDWGERLSPEDVTALTGTVGAKRERAQSLVGDVDGIVVPWNAAMRVFEDVTLPSFAAQTMRAFPGADKLHGHCFGALISLVYNRGASTSGERRSEMRAIQQMIGANQAVRVPQLFRDMQRLWPNVRGLCRRREAEARLFEQGLIAQENETRRGSPLVVASNGTATANGAAPSVLESVRAEGVAAPAHDGDGRNITDADYSDTPGVIPGRGPLESVRPDWAAVHWVDDDTLSAEYRHLRPADRARVKDASFLFTAEDLELLIRANQFATSPSEKRVIFGLRGAMLDFDPSSNGDRYAQVNRHALRLKACRPNHQHFRCIIGVYDTETRMVSGFMASTVPNRGAVNKCMQTGRDGNLLATGCYQYEVGAHSKGRFKGCLRQAQPIAVLRTRKNPVYDVADVWDISTSPDAWPMDNIHPAFSDNTYQSAEFSSFGCQVIRGSYSDGAYTQQFAAFRTALGLKEPGTDNGRRFSYVLLTGDEAAIASTLRAQNQSTDHAAVRDSLARLRQGSSGEMVTKLQETLKIRVDGTFSAGTKKILIERQSNGTDNLACDGILSPITEGALGFSVFAPPPAEPSAPPAYTVASAASNTRFESAGRASTSGNTFESVLYDIGRRSDFAEKNPALLTASVLPQYEAVSLADWGDFVGRGGRILARAERTLHEVMCGDASSDEADRSKVRQALTQSFGGGREPLTFALSKVITSTLMIPAIVSRPIAEVLYDRLAPMMRSDLGANLAPAVDQLCIYWGNKLHATPDKPAEPPSAAATGAAAAAAAAKPPPPKIVAAAPPTVASPPREDGPRPNAL